MFVLSCACDRYVRYEECNEEVLEEEFTVKDRNFYHHPAVPSVNLGLPVEWAVPRDRVPRWAPDPPTYLDPQYATDSSSSSSEDESSNKDIPDSGSSSTSD